MVLEGGEVIDGTGADREEKNLVIRGNKIAEITTRRPGEAQAIDVSGLIVAPGFIDIHSHSDLSLLEDGRGQSKAFQGVTTEVTGNCSMSPAPAPDDVREKLKNTFTYMAADVPWEWSSYEEYRQVVKNGDIALNMASLVGHGALRASVMGFEPRPATEEELAAMCERLRNCFEAGALGFSTGLIYSPGCYAEAEELVRLARVVSEYDGLYATHIENEGYRLLEAVKDALEVAKKSGARTEISHLKAAGENNWGLVRRAVDYIEQARDKGYDVSFDLYPYLVGSTYLSALLPRWARRGDREDLVRRLGKQEVRDKLREAIKTGDEDWPGYPGPGALTPEGIRISSVHSQKNQNLVGNTLAEVAAGRQAEPWECFFDLLVEEKGEIIGLYEYMDEGDVEFLYSVDHASVGSDGLAIPPSGGWLETRPHPRYYGTFPRVVDRYVQQKEVFSLEEAIKSMTSNPARCLNLKDRGSIESENVADLVIFSEDKFTDKATYEDPHRLAEGVEYLFVNGDAVIWRGKQTSNRSGRLL